MQRLKQEDATSIICSEIQQKKNYIKEIAPLSVLQTLAFAATKNNKSVEMWTLCGR